MFKTPLLAQNAIQKEEPEVAENCRPISITGALSKFLKKFYKNRSLKISLLITCSVTPIMVLEHHIEQMAQICFALILKANKMKKKTTKFVAVSLLDLLKAFDSVCPVYLQTKLRDL